MQPPLWMEVEYLQKLKTEEREQKTVLSDGLPEHYYEVSHMILKECADEIPGSTQIKSLVEDIFELRKDKLLRTLK